MKSFSHLKSNQYSIKSREIRNYIYSMMKSDADSMQADYYTKHYYGSKNAFLWIDRLGVDERADTLLTYLKTVKNIGFSDDKFCVNRISDDLIRFRSLNFDDGNHNINMVLASLEYHLTKAYLRYVVGQRYGFTNPYGMFNHLDIKNKDSLQVSYYKLFEVAMDRPNKKFWVNAINEVRHHNLSNYLTAIEPNNELYREFSKRLPSAVTRNQRVKLLCNMERARWRLKDEPQRHDKYVLVNVPSQHLMAKDGKKILSMRISIGSFDTKTPLMISQIKRMDINPQWIIPKSIIVKSISKHAQDETYFDSHRYFIRHRISGKRVDVKQVTRSMLESGDYFVIQEGGEGNALGRIVFRFNNDLAIYLHDTSSRANFEQSNRDVSHGCVRLEKPFDFAVFLLSDQDKKLSNKIQYSMTADVQSKSVFEKSSKPTVSKDTLNREKLISSVNVQPAVPLFILYYTIYPDENNVMKEYGDVYGYDRVIYQYLQNYMK